VKSLVFSTLLVTAASALAALLRYLVIEPEGVAHLCSAAAAPWWCALRAAAIAAFATGALAVGAVGAGIVAIVTRRPGAGRAAACLGAAGLVLYAVEAGAIAFLLGLLALARPRERQARGGGEQEA
jgi:hypothetical protein